MTVKKIKTGMGIYPAPLWFQRFQTKLIDNEHRNDQVRLSFAYIRQALREEDTEKSED